MCGRYSVLAEDDSEEMKTIIKEIERKLERPVNYTVGEVFPTNTVPVLLPGRPGRFKPVLMKWGFPRWDGKGVIINARCETLLEKSMFRKPFMTNRCIVPASGFYEWKRNAEREESCAGKAIVKASAREKQKYYFTLPDKSLMYMAGIWNSFEQPDGSITAAFVILTTSANESVAPFHNRMPVILQCEEREIWLTDFEKSRLLLSSLNMPQLSTLPAHAN